MCFLWDTNRVSIYCRAYDDYIRRGIGLTTGFIKHSYNTWLHFTVPSNTHALVFLVLVRSNVLSPLSVSFLSWVSPLHCQLWRLRLQLCNNLLWHPLPSLTSLTDNCLCWLQLTSYIAWGQTPKKTTVPSIVALPSDGCKQTFPLLRHVRCLSTVVNKHFLCWLVA
jgi:hypothetical protein